jgi:hypothetical protein
MAITTKDNYKARHKKMPKVKMEKGAEVPKSLPEMSYSERADYLEEKYLPRVESASMTFMISNSGLDYDLINRDESRRQLMNYYKEEADYMESDFERDTQYSFDGWELLDADGDMMEYETGDNTYNFSYLGAIDLDWRVYNDPETDKWYYVIRPHLGGDIRGNYGEAFILEGDDKEELFYRFYENWLSGFASIYIKFDDGSEVLLDSEQDSDVFYFRDSESSDATAGSLGAQFLADFETFDGWYGDEFAEELVEKHNRTDKMMAGGSVETTPSLYVSILGYNEGKWFDLTDYVNGADFEDGIKDWMDDLNDEDGGSREEWEFQDHEGMVGDYFSRYMSESELDEFYEDYEAVENSSFPASVVKEYMSDTGVDNMADAIRSMESNSYGNFREKSDFAYQLVTDGVYKPNYTEYYVSGTDKNIIAGEEADRELSDMSNADIIERVGMTDEFEEKKSDLEDEISELEDRQSEVESLLDDAEDDGTITEGLIDTLGEIESDLQTKIEELESLEDDVVSDARSEAHDLIYDEIKNRLENDLDGFLEDYNYEDVTDANFVIIDYDEIADNLESDFLYIYDEFDELYVFTNYSGGGKVIRVGKKPEYEYYIIEKTTEKIVDGHNDKAEAHSHKADMAKNNRRVRFDVLRSSQVRSKGIEPTDPKNWTSMDRFKHSNEVGLRKNAMRDMDNDIVKEAGKIRSELRGIPSKLKTADANLKKTILSDKKTMRKELGRLRGKHYLQHSSFAYGSEVKDYRVGGVMEQVDMDMETAGKMDAEHSKQKDIETAIMFDTAKSGVGKVTSKAKSGANKAGSWLKKQWQEADFGDGKGKAKFHHGGIPSQLVWLDGKKLARIKNIIGSGDRERYILFTPDMRRRLGRFRGERLSMAKDGIEVQDNYIPFDIPNHFAVALVNADTSHFTDEDDEILDEFVNEVAEQYGNAFFMTGGDESFEPRQENSNDITGSWSDNVVTLYILPSKEFNNGGDIGIGSYIAYDDNRHGTRQGTITREVDSNNWEVWRGMGYSMVGKDEVRLADKPKRRMRFFAGGGDVWQETINAWRSGTLVDEEGNPVTSKEKAYQMAHVADRRANPSKWAYDGGGSAENEYELEQYLQDWSIYNQGNPYGEGSGEYEVEIIDNHGSYSYEIWGESEEAIRKDIAPMLGDEQALEITRLYDGGGSAEDGFIETTGGNWLSVEGNKNRLVLRLTEDAFSEIEDYRERGLSDDDIMHNLFEDISANSDLTYHTNLGEAGFGLTDAEGVTKSYFMDDDGEWREDYRYPDDAQVYYHNDYMLKSPIDALLEGELVLTGASYEGGGDLKPIPEGNKGLPKLPKEVRNKMGYMDGGGDTIGVGAYVLRLYEDAHDTVFEMGYDSMDEYLEEMKSQGHGYAEFEEGQQGEKDAIYTHSDDMVSQLGNDGIAYKTYGIGYKGGGSTDDNWIQEATDEMKKKGTVGAFTKEAEKHGMDSVEFAKEVLDNPDDYSEKTRQRAQFVKNVNPEKF